MSTTASTRLSEEEAAELEAFSEREGLDRASVMKQLLRRGMREALWEEGVRDQLPSAGLDFEQSKLCYPTC